MFAPRRASLCICWSKLAEEDLRRPLAELLKHHIRQWEGHDRPRCMYCAPSSSTDEATTSSSSEGSASNASLTSYLSLPLEWLLCMRCGLVCCADHADIHHNQSNKSDDEDTSRNLESHSCYFALRTAQRPALASCRACSTCVAGTSVLPRLSDTTRELLCDLESTHRVPLEVGHLFEGLPNIFGYCSFMNAVLQCLLATPTLRHSFMSGASPIGACDKSSITTQWFRASYASPTARNKRALTESLHESHRQHFTLDDDDYRGEEDCCDYWEFVVSRLAKDLSEAAVSLPFSCTVVPSVVNQADSPRPAFGLHLVLPSSTMLDATDSVADAPLCLQALLTISAVDVALKNVRPDAVATMLLRRFTFLPNNSAVKDCRQVLFPLHFEVSSTAHRRLIGVVAHRGSLPTGHHHAYVRDEVQPNRWILCDDLRVQVVSEDLVLSEPCASILVYGPEEETPPAQASRGPAADSLVVTAS
jgi:Fe-S-cluster containining protein